MEGTNYHSTFKKALLEASQNKKYSEAIKEWTFYGNTFEEKSNCICGHPIIENCVIHNTWNKATLICGNCCINKLGVTRRPAKKSIKNTQIKHKTSINFRKIGRNEI
ncbi:MAG: hypothetical protein KAR76_01375 [Methanosarcinales archaeon]|nr:hypothetical protein [Methanosarcinales archaeon]